MSYSKLTWSIDPKIVGVKDGVGPCYLDEDFYQRHPWYAQLFLPQAAASATTGWWQPRARIPAYGGPLFHIPLEKKARHTDFIDFGGFQHGFLVNDRLRDLLERARLPRHHYFPASFQQVDQEITGYWWLCYELETGAHVDFARSEFALDQHRRLYKKAYPITSYADYLQLLSETGQAVPATKLCLTPDFDQGLDLWGTQFLTSVKGYISDKLSSAFAQHRITGHTTKNLQCPLIFSTSN
jgi:hypothetical protein